MGLKSQIKYLLIPAMVVAGLTYLIIKIENDSQNQRRAKKLKWMGVGVAAIVIGAELFRYNSNHPNTKAFLSWVKKNIEDSFGNILGYVRELCEKTQNNSIQNNYDYVYLIFNLERERLMKWWHG